MFVKASLTNTALGYQFSGMGIINTLNEIARSPEAGNVRGAHAVAMNGDKLQPEELLADAGPF